MIIGGSGSYSVQHARSASWVHPLRDVIDRALAVALPSFGICFGHQLLGYHLGSEVVTDPDRAEVGTVPIHLSDAGKKDPLFSALGPQFFAHTGHSDAVLGVPEGVELLGSSPMLETQIFKAKGACFYSTQFHPDISGAEAQSRYVAYQDELERDVPSVNMSAVSRFVPGEDESNTLLKSFLSRVVSA
jgi:GMP synthase (glutamine-hydrolysing)